ncbi:hypothetical protein GCM10023322_79840 [Rugosimonospora acidiphila]|uniref:Uncharacterized protein n=1 Tax=Rugosimonospora acidiphila TaxID=556531 RepID=A0ABP9SQP9_9ACTN
MDEERTVQALLGLRDDEGGPPSVDLGTAMRVGRGRLRRRRTAQASAGAVVAVAVVVAVPTVLHLVREPDRPASSVVAAPGGAASPPTAATSPSTAAGPTSLSCVETRLPVPQTNQEALVGGADPTGHYLIGRVYQNGRPTQPIIWHDGQYQTLSMSGSDPDLTDITPAGVAVGVSFPSGLDSTGWIYQDGRLTKLKGPYGAEPRAIADNGIIAGTETTRDSLEYPIVWHSPTSTAVRLPLPGPNWMGQADDVDSDGTIVGTVRPSVTSDESRGIVWRPGGGYQLLPVPTGIVAGANGLEVHSIRDGVIVAAGTVTDQKSKSMTPVLYRLSTAAFAPLPQANLSIAAGNAQGRIVGSGAYLAATVYTPSTGIVSLPTLVPQSTSSPTLAAIPNTISDDGSIIGGQDVDAKGVIHAVRWTCH